MFIEPKSWRLNLIKQSNFTSNNKDFTRRKQSLSEVTEELGPFVDTRQVRITQVW